MEKEEIEVIKNIKLELEMTGDMPRLVFNRNDIETILKLIEKQQKEIKELKNDHIDFWINTKEVEDMVRGKFINKDKIKEKIEEITSYAYTSASERDCQDYAIQVLKELLGE